MEQLIKILEKFDSLRNRKVGEGEWDENAVADCFAPCAQHILCSGYFLVDKRYIIDIGSIELYYHEEDGEIKDYIMYHTNDKKSRSIYNKEKGKYSYFKIGSLNLHQSGIDVTFENEEKHYRASFLIRSYRVLNNESELAGDTAYDSHSTHIYEDMFPHGISFAPGSRTTIEWKTSNKKSNLKVERLTRVNVAEYSGPNTKVGASITEEYYKVHKDEYIKIGKKYYRQDQRKWRFRIEGIIEK